MTATSVSPAVTQEQQDGFTRVWSAPPGLLGHLRTINNIPVAHKYMATGFVFFLVGGLEALLLRIQLGSPENTFLDASTYNQIFTMHGTTMMFLFVIPFIEAVANYLLPLLLGTRDLPFPRLTALSYWTYVFGGVFLYSSFLFGVAPDGGWFAYVPLTNIEFSPGINMDYWDIGLSVAEVAAIGAAAELIVAILRMRAPGMSLNRMPLFAWAMLVTAFMIVFAFTALIVGTAMLEFDRKMLTAFFKPAVGGEPLLWQHIFWVFGHPEVYIMFIPAAGIVSQVVQTFSRRPMVSYTLMVFAMIAIGFLSFGLWVHHMFTTGLSWTAMGFFTAASMMIAIPSGVQVFGWIATIWTGRPVWNTALLFVAGFIVIFVLGGVTGVMVAAVPFDGQVHDTFFVVAHFHYVLIGGVVFPLFAGLYYWLPKVTGRLLDERLGKWNFWSMFVLFNVAFFPMHILGLLGMPRRVYTYAEGLGWDGYNLISTVGAFGFAAGILLFVVNFLRSFRHGEPAGDNPWDGDTLEWSQSSPPPEAQFPTLPVVRSRHPMWEQESLDPEDPVTERQLRELDWGPVRWRGGMVVSMIDARPLAIVQMPGPSVWPFVMAVAFVLLFAGALLDNGFLLGAGGAVTAIALTGWFWPTKESRWALEEIGVESDGKALPLAVAGPLSNGWWGTVVFLLILATALACLVASYFYLGEGPATWPPVAPHDLTVPTATLGAALMGAAAAYWARRELRQGAGATGRRLALAGAVATQLGALVLLYLAGRVAELEPAARAYDSIVTFLLAFQALLAITLLIMLGLALGWAVRRPADPRGHSVAHNGALVAYFAAASWIVILATVYLSPRGV